MSLVQVVGGRTPLQASVQRPAVARNGGLATFPRRLKLRRLTVKGWQSNEAAEARRDGIAPRGPHSTARWIRRLRHLIEYCGHACHFDVQQRSRAFASRA